MCYLVKFTAIFILEEVSSRNVPELALVGCAVAATIRGKSIRTVNIRQRHMTIMTEDMGSMIHGMRITGLMQLRAEHHMLQNMRVHLGHCLHEM